MKCVYKYSVSFENINMDDEILLRKIEETLNQLEAGDFLTSEELDKAIESWT